MKFLINCAEYVLLSSTFCYIEIYISELLAVATDIIMYLTVIPSLINSLLKSE